MLSVTVFDRHIQPILADPRHSKTRDRIDISSRVARVIFGVGFAFTSLKTIWNLGLILTGGSFLFHGFLLTLNACTAIGCHDLFRVANNVSSIFNKGVINRYCHAYVGNVTGFINSLKESAENLARITNPPEMHLGRIPGFVSALTQDTVVFSIFNPEIVKILNRSA